MINVPFDNTYARLSNSFYAAAQPSRVPAPQLVHLNQPLLDALGIIVDPWNEGDIAQAFSGNVPLAGSEPVALAYAGHQFGQFVPQLGDGRAVLLGEVVDQANVRRDLQLKGSGRTAFSRGGDGKAPIGPVLREYLVSEAMHALGVRTTRALAAVTTGENVFRDASVPGAVLTRVASSHVRIGTVQYFAAREDKSALRTLINYVMQRHYPHLADAERPGMALLGAVVEAQAKLVSQWMCLGFIHGVMNTDNMSLCGETIDYGPCAFMENYHPTTKFSSIDTAGRYAYGNQPIVAQWNLARLAEALLSAEDDADSRLEEAKALIGQFFEHYERYWLEGMSAKLGLLRPQHGDAELIQDWLDLLAANEVDFTLAFRALAAAQDPTADAAPLQAQFTDQPALAQWLSQWRRRLQDDEQAPSARGARMQRTNPALIPRNHRVEAALSAAEKGDYQPFKTLLALLQNPFVETAENASYGLPAQPTERVFRTFCGT
ncbi:MAG: YdiU family protein [Natronospirillum sp.]